MSFLQSIYRLRALIQFAGMPSCEHKRGRSLGEKRKAELQRMGKGNICSKIVKTGPNKGTEIFYTTEKGYALEQKIKAKEEAEKNQKGKVAPTLPIHEQKKTEAYGLMAKEISSLVESLGGNKIDVKDFSGEANLGVFGFLAKMGDLHDITPSKQLREKVNEYFKTHPYLKSAVVDIEKNRYEYIYSALKSIEAVPKEMEKALKNIAVLEFSKSIERSEGVIVLGEMKIIGSHKDGKTSNRVKEKIKELKRRRQYKTRITLNIGRGWGKFPKRTTPSTFVHELGHAITRDIQLLDYKNDKDKVSSKLKDFLGHFVDRKALDDDYHGLWTNIGMAEFRPNAQFITEYSKTSAHELFAETYREYVEDKERLRKKMLPESFRAFEGLMVAFFGSKEKRRKKGV